MKLGFLLADNDFSHMMFQQLKDRLKEHELLLWVTGDAVPARDLEGLLLMGSVTKEEMDAQPKLGFLQTVSAGYEGVDVDAATALGVWVSFAPSEITGNAVAVAEFAVLLMLGASRRLNQALHAVRDHAVAVPRFNPALSGKTVCIVGLGGIGRLLAERLLPFGMRILATEDHPKDVPEGVTVSPTDQLTSILAESDYVVLCLRADKENANLFDAAMFRAMKQGAILVNVARGSLIDEAALYDAVKSGHLAAAGLDVMHTEPVDPQSPLLTLPQVLITPHIAGPSDLMLQGTVDYVAKAVGDFAGGTRPSSLVNAPEKPRLVLR